MFNLHRNKILVPAYEALDNCEFNSAIQYALKYPLLPESTLIHAWANLFSTTNFLAIEKLVTDLLGSININSADLNAVQIQYQSYCLLLQAYTFNLKLKSAQINLTANGQVTKIDLKINETKEKLSALLKRIAHNNFNQNKLEYYHYELIADELLAIKKIKPDLSALSVLADNTIAYARQALLPKNHAYTALMIAAKALLMRYSFETENYQLLIRIIQYCNLIIEKIKTTPLQKYLTLIIRAEAKLYFNDKQAVKQDFLEILQIPHEQDPDGGPPQVYWDWGVDPYYPGYLLLKHKIRQIYSELLTELGLR